jgi:hypothetical protein
MQLAHDPGVRIACAEPDLDAHHQHGVIRGAHDGQRPGRAFLARAARHTLAVFDHVVTGIEHDLERSPGHVGAEVDDDGSQHHASGSRDGVRALERRVRSTGSVLLLPVRPSHEIFAGVGFERSRPSNAAGHRTLGSRAPRAGRRVRPEPEPRTPEE